MHPPQHFAILPHQPGAAIATTDTIEHRHAIFKAQWQWLCPWRGLKLKPAAAPQCLQHLLLQGIVLLWVVWIVYPREFDIRLTANSFKFLLHHTLDHALILSF